MANVEFLECEPTNEDMQDSLSYHEDGAYLVEYERQADIARKKHNSEAIVRIAGNITSAQLDIVKLEATMDGRDYRALRKALAIASYCCGNVASWCCNGESED